MAATTDIPIIDSHIHLYPASELDSLAWCAPGHALAKQQSVAEYKAATSGAAAGFIFVETDRKHDLEAADESGWAAPLQEVAWLRRIASGEPRAGEGHGAEDAALCVGYVPWAPLPSGPAALERYFELVQRDAGESFEKVRGFRYLVQDRPDRTMLGEGFIDGLKLLGRRGYAFDLGVNQHARGRAQLEEAVEMVEKAHDGVPEAERVTFILNHMCKPDLTVYNTMTDTSFIAWRTAMFTLSKASRTYVKLSGAFSEMPASLRARPVEDIFDALSPWLTVLVAAFGPSRIMFGSDWPVCTLDMGEGEGEGENAWLKWRKIVDRLCYMASFDDEDKRMIWGGTALKAYGIEK